MSTHYLICLQKSGTKYDHIHKYDPFANIVLATYVFVLKESDIIVQIYIMYYAVMNKCCESYCALHDVPFVHFPIFTEKRKT